MEETVVMVSPSGEKRTVVVTDPRTDLVPLMVKGWSQLMEPAAEGTVG